MTAKSRRTREGILEASRRLLATGAKPTMSALAVEAGVSRATLYRYFPREDVLAIEASLHGDVPPTDALLDSLPEDPAQRAAGVVRAYFEHSAKNETTFRHYLRAILESMLHDTDGSSPSRGGRRLEALEAALGPAGLDPAAAAKLRYALAALTGIEALIVMKDICGLKESEALEVVSWAALSLVEKAIAEMGDDRG